MMPSEDILDTASKKYHEIPDCYRKSFWGIFIITTLVFSGVIMWSLFGNHDFPAFYRGDSWKGLLHIGRLFARIPIQLTNGFILPITTVLGFFFFSLAAVLFCVLFTLPKKKAYYYLVGLLITLHPYFLGKLYYGGWLESYVGTVLIFTGFLLYQKKVRGYIFLTFLCFFIALGMYQIFLNTLSIVFILLLLNEVCFEDKSIKELFYDYGRLALIIIASALSYYFYMKVFNILENSYITAVHSSFPQILDTVPSLMFENFIEFIDSRNPISMKMKRVSSLLVLCAFISIIISVKRSKKDVFLKLALAFLLMLYTLFFHNISVFITPSAGSISGVMGFRVNFHGILFVYAFAAIILLRSKKIWLRNASIVVIAILVWWMMVADFRAQQVWKLSQDSEYYARNRILARMETLDGFEMNKKYTLVQVGYLPVWSDNFYKKSFRKTFELSRPYEFDGNQGSFFRHIMPTAEFRGLPTYDPRYKKLIIENRALLENSKAYPDKSSLYLVEDTIFLIFDEELLDSILDSEGKDDENS